MAISFVGSLAGSHVSSSAQTVNFSGLQDSSGSTPTLQQDDLVVVVYAHAQATTASRTLAQCTPTGYTAAHASVLLSNDTNAVSGAVSYKFMGSTPDTSVSIPAVATATTNGCAYTVHVFRGVDTTTPIDVGTTTAVAANSAVANAPLSGTPTKEANWILACGMAAAAVGTAFTNPSGMSATTNHFRSATSGTNSTNDAVVGLAINTAGTTSTYDPAVFGGSTSTNTGAWAAATVVLRRANVISTVGSSLNGVGTLTASASSFTPYTGWTPSVLGSANKAQWDIWDTSTLTTSGSSPIKIDQVNDKSGNGFHLAVRGTATKPDLVNDAFTTTSGSSMALATSSMDLSAFFTGGDGLFFCVVQVASAGVWCKWEVDAFTNRFGLETSNRVDWPNDQGGQLSGWSTDLTGTPKILTVRKTPTGKIVRLNGVQVASDSNTQDPSTNSKNFVVGAHDINGSAGASITLLSMGFIDDYSSTTCEKVEGYLAHAIVASGAVAGANLLTNLDSSHPYKSSPPSSGSSPSTYTVGATLAGAGTIAANADKLCPIASSLNGAGTLNASVGTLLPVTTSLAGAGTLTATAIDVIPVATALSGAGTLNANAVKYIPVGATLNGAATVSASATVTPIITTWNPSDAISGYLTFSNGNKTVTGTNGVGAPVEVVRATTPKTGGVVTYSATLNTLISTDVRLGVASSLLPIFPVSGYAAPGGESHSIGWDIAATRWLYVEGNSIDLANINGGGGTWGISGGAGKVYSILLDTSAKKIYLAIDGSPIAGMDPVAKTGGVSYTTTDPLFPVVGMGQADQVTVNGLPSYVPTGWSAWDTSNVSTLTAAASLNAIGTLGGDLRTIIPVTTTLSGTGTLTANATKLTPALDIEAVLSGAGTLTSSIFNINKAVSTLSTVGTITASIIQTALASSALNSAGTISGTILNIIPLASTLNGAGTIAPTAINVIPVASSLNGAGTQTASVGTVMPVAAALSGAGTISANVVVRNVVAASLNGAGTINATANINGAVSTWNVGAILNGAGTLTANPFRYALCSASLTGVGTLGGDLRTIIPVASSLNGAATTSANALVYVPANASLNGAGTINATAVAIQPVTAPQNALGTLVAQCGVIKPVASSNGASGTINANILAFVLGTSSLTGSGALSASLVNIVPLASATNGTATLNATAVAIRNSEATMTTSGTMSANVITKIVVGAPMATVGTINASPALIRLARARRQTYWF